MKFEKYEQMWDAIKNKLKIKFHSEPVYEYKYLKTKVREYDGVIKTNFLGNGIPKENMHYSGIACITIDSVIKMDEKYFPQVYLEECNYRMKMPKFIDAELKSDSGNSNDSDDDNDDDSDDDSDDSDDDNDDDLDDDSDDSDNDSDDDSGK